MKLHYVYAVCCGEFSGSLPSETHDPHKTSEVLDQKSEIVRRLKDLHGPLESGLTIIYVPTRKETLKIAKYLGKFGIRAAAYHAGVSLFGYFGFFYHAFEITKWFQNFSWHHIDTFILLISNIK